MELDFPQLEPRIDVVRIPRKNRAVGALGFYRATGAPLSKRVEQTPIAG
jgi:hypothetical protein